MSQQYIFDKRVVRAHLKKYGIIMLCILPLLIAINVLIGNRLKSGVVMLIDIVVALVIIFIVDTIINKIQDMKANKAEKVARVEDIKNRRRSK